MLPVTVADPRHSPDLTCPTCGGRPRRDGRKRKYWWAPWGLTLSVGAIARDLRVSAVSPGVSPCYSWPEEAAMRRTSPTKLHEIVARGTTDKQEQ